MFISKVILKRGPSLFNLLKQKTGSDGYVVHQLLWGLFPNGGDKKRDFLFHKDDRGSFPQFLLVSKTEPIERDGISVITKPYSPQLVDGQQLAFTLVANPVVSRKVEGKKHSVKHDVWMDAKFQAKKRGLVGESLAAVCADASKSWLIRQGERCGFLLDRSGVAVDGYHQNRFYKRGKMASICHSSINYEGVLTVTESMKFIDMLFSGIGRSKSFGCGLMLVRRM